LHGVNVENFFLALILLGVGWNFGFIGATTMLASAHNPEEKGIVQGMNDFFVFGGVTMASLASGGFDELLRWLGGGRVERRQHCDGSVSDTGRERVNLARHSKASRLVSFRATRSNAYFIQNRLNTGRSRRRCNLRLQRIKADPQSGLFVAVEIIPQPPLQPHHQDIIGNKNRGVRLIAANANTLHPRPCHAIHWRW
jgi:hypothetical protein